MIDSKKVNYSTVTDLQGYVVYQHLNLCVMLHSKLIVMQPLILMALTIHVHEE